MADVGLEFNSDSFKVFNQTLKEFDKITKTVDKKLDQVATSIEKVLSSANITSIRNFETFQISFGKFILDAKKMSGNPINKIQFSVGQLLKSVSSYGILQFESFTQAFDRFGDSFAKISTTAITSTANSLKNFFKALEAFKPSQSSKVIIELSYFFEQLGVIINQIGKFGDGRASAFLKVSNSIKTIINTIEQVKNITVTVSDIDNLAIIFNRFQEIFTGGVGFGNLFKRIKGMFLGGLDIMETLKNLGSININQLKDFASGIKLFIESLNMLKDVNFSALNLQEFAKSFREFSAIFTGLTGLRGFGQRIAGFFTGRLGIVNVINSLGTIRIANFGDFANGVKDLITALRSYVSQKINVGDVKNNNAALTEFMRVFTGGTNIFDRMLRPLDLLLGRGGILNVLGSFDPKTIEGFKHFGRGIRAITESFAYISRSRIDKASIRNFADSVGYLVQQLAKAFRGGIFGTGFLSSRTRDLKTIEEALNVLEKLSRIKIDVKNIEEALSLPGLKTSLSKTGEMGASALIASFKRKLRIASPSRVFEQFGENITQGLQRGLRDIGEVFRSVLTRLTGLFSSVKNKVDNFFEAKRAQSELKKLEREARQSTSRIGGFFQTLRDRIVFSIDIGDLGALADRLWNVLSPRALMEQFIEFESAFTGVVKTLDTSGMSDTEAAQFIQDLQDDVRSMSTEEGGVLSGLENAAVSISGIMESAGQLGIAREDLQAFTETVGAMTLATNLSEDAAADFFGQFGAITQSNNFAQIGSTMVGLGNNFASTETQIADFALRLAGAGSQAGLTEAEILGISAAMAAVGLNSEAGGTAMTQILNEITVATVEGGEKLDKFAELAGVSAEEFAASWEEDAAGTLEKFISGLGELENAEQIQVLDQLGLDGIRTADVLRRLGGAEGTLAKALEIANEEWIKNSALMSEAEKRALTTRSAVNRMKNNFFDLKVTVGEILQPVFMSFVNTLTNGIRGFNEWLKTNKEAIQEVFPKIIGFFTELRNRFNLFFLLFESFPLKTFTTALQNIAQAFKLLFSGDAEMATYQFKLFFENIKKGLSEIVNIFKFSFFGDVSSGGSLIMDAINGLFVAVKNQEWAVAIDIVKNAIKSIFVGAADRLFGEGSVFGIENSAVAEILRQNFEGLDDPKNFTEAVNKVVLGIRLALYDISKGDFEGVKNFIKDHIAQIVRSALSLIVSAVFGFPVGTVFSLANLIIGAIESDFLGIRGMLEQSTIGQAIIGLADGINQLIEQAFSGLFGDSEEDPMTDAMLRHLGHDPRGGSGGSIIDKIKTALFGDGVIDLTDNPIFEGLQEVVKMIDDIVQQIRDINFDDVSETLTGFFDIAAGIGAGAVLTSIMILQNVVLPVISNVVTQIQKIAGSVNPANMAIFAGGFAIFKGVLASLVNFALPLVGLFALIGGVSNSIGDFVLAISSVFDAIGMLLVNDYSGALEKFGDAAHHLWDGVKNFVSGAVQPFIDLINTILEMDAIQDLIPDGSIFEPLKNGLISVGEAFELLELLAMGILLKLQRTFEDIFYKMTFQFNDLKVRGLQALRDTGLATGDQLLQLDEAILERDALNAVEQIQSSIFNAAAHNKGLDLSKMITFDQWDGTTFTGSLESALNNPEIVSRLSGSTKQMLLMAAEKAMQSGDGKAIADALNIFAALEQVAPEIPAGTQQIIATSLAEYKKLIEMEYDNVVLELPDMFQLLAQASFDQAMGGSAQFQIPEGMGIQFAQQFNAGLTAIMQSNPLDLAGIFNTNALLNQNSEVLTKAGVDMAAALRESVANAFTTGLEATGDASWAAGSVLDEFLPLLNLSGSQEEIQAQFNEQLALLTQNLNAEDALAIGQALEIKLEEIILAGTGATIDLQVDKEAIDAAGAEAMKQNGLDVIGGLLAGVGEMLGIDTLSTEAEKVFTSFNDAFKAAAGIASPSQVFIDNGKSLVDGLNQGVTEQMPIYQQTMTLMADEITKFKDHTNIQVEEFKTILTGIPLAILDTGLQFTNAVMIWAVQGLVFGFILDTIALKIAGVADQLSILAAHLGLVGGSLGNLSIPGGSGDDAAGRAMGGDVRRGKIYEVLENNLPFEMFKTKGKTYFISNSDGMMLSPLTANAIGAGNISNNTTNNTSGDVVMNFNINSNDPEEIVRIAKREFHNERREEAKKEKRVQKRTGVYGV